MSHYRLPSGRHGLPREVVTESQRARLTAAMIAVVAEHGYEGATMNEIVGAAGVSKRTFYGYFASKEECFFNTFDAIARHLETAMRAAGAEDDEWPERVKLRIGAMLEAFAANPDLARFVLIVPAAGRGEVAERYRELLASLLAILVDDAPDDVARRPSPGAEESLMGAVAALIGRSVRAGEGEKLADLKPVLTELVLTPYLGRRAAQKTIS
jgi:AcrR family transcriptional regulator